MKKWMIAIIGVLVHLCLGTVYAWSFFQAPLVESTGWSNTQTAMAFSLSIIMLGLAAAWGGIKLPKYGPRKLAVLGGLLYAIGYLVSAWALKQDSLIGLYFGFGFLGGTGLGLAYVVPVATVSKWFTKYQGLATGMVVMGFGFGALIMSKVLAPVFLEISGGDIAQTFQYTGILFLILIPSLAWFLENPKSTKSAATSENKQEVKSLIISKRFAIIWFMFLVNIIAGMIFIAFQSPLLQDIIQIENPSLDAKKLAAYGATLIAVSSVFNGLGRFTWASISDKIGRLNSFRALIMLQCVIFLVLTVVKNPVVFSALVCIILLCYGGGFGLMPSLIKDIYGVQLMSIMYGVVLTAWSLGGLIGPQLVAFLKDNYPQNVAFLSYSISGNTLFVAFLLSYLIKEKV